MKTAEKEIQELTAFLVRMLAVCIDTAREIQDISLRKDKKIVFLKDL